MRRSVPAIILCCIAGSYALLSLCCLAIEVAALWSGAIAVNAWNLTLFLWMPVVVLFVLLLALSPLLLLAAVFHLVA